MQIQKRDIKVLVSADINGRFEQVIPKVTQIHSKNHFDLMLLLGEVCHPRASPFVSNIISGQNELPLQLNFIDRSEFSPVLLNLHPEGKQIVPNFRFLGKNGLAHLKGLNIAFFSGYDENQDATQFETQIQSFLAKCEDKDIDILLTNQWPEEIKIISEKTSPKTAKYVSIISNHLSPRYHFAAGCDSFFRLSPYRNSKGRLTHFISIAPCLEELKDKYLFAITIKPNSIQVAPQNNATCLENPFLKPDLPLNSNQQTLSIQQRMSKQQEKKSEKPQGQVVVFFEGFPDWARKEDISEFLERWGQIKHLESFKDKRGGRSGTVRFTDDSSTQACLGYSAKFMFNTSRIKFQARSIQDRQRVEDCWFCKTNTDRSLIVWEGRYVYLCLEKGPLCKFHLQIIPYNHTQSSTRLDPQEQEELNKVKQRLTSHFSDEEYQVIVYERCLPLSEAVNHCVIHLLPVKRPQSLSRNFQMINKNDLLGFKEWSNDKRGSQYFLNLQIGAKTYQKEVQRREKVQADFMRQMLCELLQTPKLVNWKMCQRRPEQLISQLELAIEQVKKAGLSS